jgi:dTDP-4-amino-4,6-dideoxygalactose transaminase
MPISTFRPTIKRRDMDAVLSSLVDDRIGPGPTSQEFVKECASYTNTSGGVAFREYRRAVEAVFDAMEIGPGSVLIVSPLAPRVYHDVVAARGIKPLYADVNQDTGCISVGAVEALSDFEPVACVVDSPAGFIPELNALADLGIPLIEDISASLGGNCLSRKCGSFGRYTVISLETRNMITAAGGAVALAATKRDLGILKKTIEYLDTTFLLPDMNAALAGIQLKQIEEYIERRRDIAAVYTRSIAKGKHRTFVQDGDSENVYFSFPVVIDGGVKDAVNYARSKRIMTARAFEDAAVFWADGNDPDCPNAHALFLRCVFFPLYPLLSKEQIERISRVLSSLP